MLAEVLQEAGLGVWVVPGSAIPSKQQGLWLGGKLLR